MEVATRNNSSSICPDQQCRQVHLITDRFSMTNTYLINDDRIVVVDPGSTLNVDLLLDYLQRFLQRTAAEIDLIVLTHLHPDHTTGVIPLREFCHAPVAVSAVACQLAQVEREQAGHRVVLGITDVVRHLLPETLRHLDLFSPPYARQMEMVDLWLEDVASLPNHPNWRVIASPGHTPESLCLYNPFTRELLCGDTVITTEGSKPFVHRGTHRRQLEETLHTLRHLQINYLYPGHGRPVLSKQPLRHLDFDW